MTVLMLFRRRRSGLGPGARAAAGAGWPHCSRGAMGGAARLEQRSGPSAALLSVAGLGELDALLASSAARCARRMQGIVRCPRDDRRVFAPICRARWSIWWPGGRSWSGRRAAPNGRPRAARRRPAATAEPCSAAERGGGADRQRACLAVGDDGGDAERDDGAEEGGEVDAVYVRSIIRARRMRDQYFKGELFADPAFDMLLDLYAARLEGAAWR
jgi:hypothetical protein